MFWAREVGSCRARLGKLTWPIFQDIPHFDQISSHPLSLVSLHSRRLLLFHWPHKIFQNIPHPDITAWDCRPTSFCNLLAYNYSACNSCLKNFDGKVTIPLHFSIFLPNCILESNECNAFLWDALKMQWQGREAINYSIDCRDIWGNFPMVSQSNMSRAICGGAQANDPCRSLFRNPYYINSTLIPPPPTKCNRTYLPSMLFSG